MQRSYLVFLFTFVFATKSKHRKQHAQSKKTCMWSFIPCCWKFFGLAWSFSNFFSFLKSFVWSLNEEDFTVRCCYYFRYHWFYWINRCIFCSLFLVQSSKIGTWNRNFTWIRINNCVFRKICMRQVIGKDCIEWRTFFTKTTKHCEAITTSKPRNRLLLDNKFQ